MKKYSSNLMVVLLYLCLAHSLTFQAVAADNCYKIGKVPLEKQSYSSSAVVLLDETVVFDSGQLKHGVELRVFTFSAFRDGRYTLPVLDVWLAAPVSEDARNSMRKDTLRDFDTCQQVSIIRARRQLESLLTHYFDRSSNALASSDIVGTLKQIGEAVFPSLRSKNRHLVLVSDMLENSSTSSFYGAGGAPRIIDAVNELSKVEKNSLFSDFRGASVYVIGAGVVPAVDKSSGGTYRSQTVMAPLKSFWTQYFEKSNAKIAEFGQPLLLAPIGGQK